MKICLITPTNDVKTTSNLEGRFCIASEAARHLGYRRWFKEEADACITQNAKILTNEAFAKTEMNRLIIEQLKNNHQLPLTADIIQFINSLVMDEYLNEYHGRQIA